MNVGRLRSISSGIEEKNRLRSGFLFGAYRETKESKCSSASRCTCTKWPSSSRITLLTLWVSLTIMAVPQDLFDTEEDTTLNPELQNHFLMDSCDEACVSCRHAKSTLMHLSQSTSAVLFKRSLRPLTFNDKRLNVNDLKKRNHPPPQLMMRQAPPTRQQLLPAGLAHRSEGDSL